MYRIGDFSKLTQVSIRMLRYYDETGLLKPAKIDKFTNYRLYSAAQIPTLNKIKALRDMGFLVSEISNILRKDDNSFLQFLDEKEREISENILSQKVKLEKIMRMKDAVKIKDTKFHYEVTIKSLPSYNVVSLRDTIPDYFHEFLLWNKICDFIEREKVVCSDDSTPFTIYHDKDYRQVDVDVEVVIPVKVLTDSSNGFTFRKVEAVEHMACIMVYGPFENIGPAYQSFASWLEQQEIYTMLEPTRQVCYKGPWSTSNPQEYLTELQIPVSAAVL